MTPRPADGARDRARSGPERIDRARLDEVFGETMPATPSDEERGRDSSLDDDWWREQRPPHHG